MKCPHCRVDFHNNPEFQPLGNDADDDWAIISNACPSCQRLIFHLISGTYRKNEHGVAVGMDWTRGLVLVRPKAGLRPPAPPDVPRDLADDFNEASTVLGESPKASAALSRRCLQHLLHDHAKVRHSTLADEIQEIIDQGTLPSHLVDAIDAVRNIGNFAAHPIKSQSTGEVLPVEPGEAEWNLDTLEAFFDFFFVQPESVKKKRAALDAKLKSAGKPPMKR